MFARCVALALIAAACAGCASDESQPVRWSKPGASYDQFAADRAACVAQTHAETRPFMLGGQRYGETRNQPVLDASVFFPCMAARGYTRDPNGFAAPPGEQLPLAP